ncbi:MAG: biotin transporter BioY [Lachnospiraceae bacterium]|nr:biotin transporter BioY [Lachnospiraceae bacterium]MBO5146860.1 biotin transporter BioY [Lachnospiraceae bacterium]
MKKQFITTKQMALVGVMTAVTCILGPLSIPIPISPVPISFTVLAVFLAAYVLGPRLGTLSYVIYLLLGMVGLPVFSGFIGGIGKLAGPTGGYLIGFIPMVLIVGWFIEHYNAKIVPSFIGMMIGTVVCYVFGSIWLASQTSRTFFEALSIGALPYIPADIVKMIVAVILGTQLRKAVRKLY